MFGPCFVICYALRCVISSFAIILMGKRLLVDVRTACLVVNLITFGNFAFLFNCTPVGRTSDYMAVPT